MPIFLLVIVVPYTPSGLRRETAEWADSNNASLVDVSESITSYWEVLSAHWNGIEELVVVEHDMLPAPGVIYSMQMCEHGWCTSPYYVGRLWVQHCLGLARFSVGLQQKIPDALDLAALPCVGDLREPERAWWTIDYRLDHVFRSHNVSPHVHAASQHLGKSAAGKREF